MDPRSWIVCGALLGAIGVGIGAYGAHGLKERLRQQEFSEETIVKRLDQCQVAVRYQMTHALAMVLVGALALGRRSRWLHVAGTCFLLGVVLFSGMLYSQALFGQSIHLLIPLGGLAFIVGWCALAVAGCRLGSKAGEHSKNS